MWKCFFSRQGMGGKKGGKKLQLDARLIMQNDDHVRCW